MAKEVVHAHDKYFKSLMSDKIAASEFVQQFLPTAVSKKLRLDTLALAKTDYLDSQLGGHFSDVVYDCVYQGDEQDIEVQVSLLVEHKSQPDQYPYMQLLRYILNAWEAQIKQKQPSPDISPVRRLLCHYLLNINSLSYQCQ